MIVRRPQTGAWLLLLAAGVAACQSSPARAYTSGDAYGVFAERTRGRLAPGYKADLVLLDQDLTRIPPEAIERASVRATVVGGRVVYQAK